MNLGSYIGIDVSKDVLDVAILSSDGEVKSFRLSNDAAGHQRLLELAEPSTQVIVEATGVYHRQLQKRLSGAGIAVSVVNPRQALSYAKSQQWRNKTDKVDAVLLAQFGRERELPPSPQLAPAQQSLARELAALKEDLRRLRNRLEAAEHGLAHPEVPSSLKRRISTLEDEQKVLEKQLEDQLKQTCPEPLELLQSIPGVGLRSACLLLAELGDFRRFRSARSLVAFAGLTPMRHESGKTSRYSAISRMGSTHLRRLLYMPALSATSWNPRVKSFYLKLVERGKPKKVALVAAMAKLLRIIYGVLVSAKPFSTPPTP